MDSVTTIETWHDERIRGAVDWPDAPQANRTKPAAQGNSLPRVTVGMPVYNGERYIRSAIESVLAQTLTEFELIISDNCSTDATERICLEYAAHDARIRYYRQQENKGGAWNFNHVVELARGPYFKWASHDDVLAPTFLERCADALDSQPQVVVAYPLTVKIDENGRDVIKLRTRLRTDSPSAAIRFHDLIRVPHGCYQGSGLIRTDVLRRTPILGRYAGSDRVLLAWLGLLGEFYEVQEFLFYSRSHAKQSVRSSRFDRMSWFDPSRSGRLAFPTWRIFKELIVCTREVPLRSVDRMRVQLDVLRWPMWNGSGVYMITDLRRAALLLPRMAVSGLLRAFARRRT